MTLEQMIAKRVDEMNEGDLRSALKQLVGSAIGNPDDDFETPVDSMEAVFDAMGDHGLSLSQLEGRFGPRDEDGE